MDQGSMYEQLRDEGVLQRDGTGYQTTRRWRAARHRASSSRDAASDRVDRRNPIVMALIEIYGSQRSLESLSPFVALMHAIEAAERAPASKPGA